VYADTGLTKTLRSRSWDLDKGSNPFLPAKINR